LGESGWGGGGAAVVEMGTERLRWVGDIQRDKMSLVMYLWMLVFPPVP